MKTTPKTGGDTPTPSQAPLSAGEVPELPVAGYRINTGHGNHLTEGLDEARRSFMWAGKPAWRELTYRDTAQATIHAQAAEIERLKEVMRERALQALSDDGQWIEETGRLHAELTALKAKQVAEADEVMRLADEYAGENYKAERFGGHYCEDRYTAREALRAFLTKDCT